MLGYGEGRSGRAVMMCWGEMGSGNDFSGIAADLQKTGYGNLTIGSDIGV